MLRRSIAVVLGVGILAGCGASSGSSLGVGNGGTAGSSGSVNFFGGSSNGAGSNAGGTGQGGSGSGAGGQNIGGFGAGGDTSPATTDAGCNGIASAGEQIPLDIFVMFDQSLSMNCEVQNSTRWDAVKNALDGFVNDPGAAGIGVGIGYFGNQGPNSSCNPMDYQTPDVEIAPLPGNANAIVQSLNNHKPSTNTTTAAALSGAINHAIAYRMNNPGHTVIVLLVTDGQPNACGTVQDVATVAAAGLSGANIPTYVIGVTSPGVPCTGDPNPPNKPDLDTVAKAGGSDQSTIVDLTGNTAQEFLDSMNAIRGMAQVPCQYQLPRPAAGTQFVYDKVNVLYGDSSGSHTVFYVANQQACGATNGGWYYDVDPSQGTPTKIILCPTTCTTVTAGTGVNVNIQLNCATVIGPPS